MLIILIFDTSLIIDKLYIDRYIPLCINQLLQISDWLRSSSKRCVFIILTKSMIYDQALLWPVPANSLFIWNICIKFIYKSLQTFLSHYLFSFTGNFEILFVSLLLILFWRSSINFSDSSFTLKYGASSIVFEVCDWFSFNYINLNTKIRICITEIPWLRLSDDNALFSELRL